MKASFKNSLFAFALLLLAACIFDDSEEEKWDAAKVCPETGTNAYGMPNRGTFTDERDGNVYRYTTIGDQVWMAENLRFELPALYSMCYGYGMGYCYPQNRALTDTAITCVKDTASLAEIAQRMQSTCTDNDCIAREFCDKFGRYYAFNDRVPLKTYSILNRDIVDTVCPKGWHLPTKAEWIALRASVENEYLRLTSDDARFTNTKYNKVGSDDCGFSALRGGSIGGKTHRGGALYYAFSSGYYWAAPDGNQGSVKTMVLATNVDLPFEPDTDFLNSIRCVKDTPL